MGPNNMLFASSPTVVLPAPQPINGFGTSPTTSPFTNAPPSPPRQTSLPSQSSFTSTASRKRSRDDMASPTSPDFVDASNFPPLPINSEPLFPPQDPFAAQKNVFSIETSNQTDGWTNGASQSPFAQGITSTPTSTTTPSLPTKPLLMSRKSQRLDSSASIDSTGSPYSVTAFPDSPPKSGPSEPTIDDFTVQLGVGWKRIASSGANDDEAPMAAAARGWARYIENHYPLNGVSILLESSGLNSYLITCQEGFYLFREDLGEGRLVGRDLETAMRNLGSVPVVFEAGDSVLPVGTPSFSGGATPSTVVVETPKEELPAILEEPAGQEFVMEMD